MGRWRPGLDVHGFAALVSKITPSWKPWTDSTHSRSLSASPVVAGPQTQAEELGLVDSPGIDDPGQTFFLSFPLLT